MSTVMLAGSTVEVDGEGFLLHTAEWNRADRRGDRARQRHRAADRPPLAGDRLHARRLPRERCGPGIRTLGKTSGVPIKELYELFPKGPAKLAAKIGGIPKPRGCI